MSTAKPTEDDATPTAATGGTVEPRPESDKTAVYRRLADELPALLGDLDDPVAVMASAAALIHQSVTWSSWTGFYRVVTPGLLRIGPYQGPPGCLEISFGRGVCGAAASQRRTQLVPDVHAFPGHIACDPRARSEIVVPVLDAGGELCAVLDLDSHRPTAFDGADRVGLEQLATLLTPHLPG